MRWRYDGQLPPIMSASGIQASPGASVNKASVFL
jgi:hypothetical protein